MCETSPWSSAGIFRRLQRMRSHVVDEDQPHGKVDIKRPTLSQSFTVSDLDREFWDLLLPIS